MKITALSPSRQKTYDLCTYKYVITYLLYTCTKCSKIQFDTEFIDKVCKFCSEPVKKVELRSNWGAAHGTALHWILENYANACRLQDEDGKVVAKHLTNGMLDWKSNVMAIYQRGHEHQGDKKFSILDLAKDKDYKNIPKVCDSCPFFEKSVCKITNEDVNSMAGCPKPLYEESLSILTPFMRRMKKIYTNGKILGVEAPFEIDLGGKNSDGKPMTVVGFMDFVHEVDKDTLEMIDYKAGAHTQSYDEVYKDIQAKVYSVALKQKYPGYANYLLTFDYLREKPVTVCYSNDEDQLTLQDLYKKYKQIDCSQSISRNIGWHCKAMCDKTVCDATWPEFKKRFGAK